MTTSDDIFIRSVPQLPPPVKLKNYPTPLVLPPEWETQENVFGVEWGIGWDTDGRLWVRKKHKHVISGGRKPNLKLLPIKLQDIIEQQRSFPPRNRYYVFSETYTKDWVLRAGTYKNLGIWRRDHRTLSLMSIALYEIRVVSPLASTISEETFEQPSEIHKGKVSNVLVTNKHTGRTYSLFRRTTA